MTTPKISDAASTILDNFLTAVPDVMSGSDRFGMTSETSLPYGTVTFEDNCNSAAITLVRNDVNGQPVEKYDIGVNPNGSTYMGVSVTRNTSPKIGRRLKKTPMTTGLRRVSETQGKLAEGIKGYMTHIIGSMENPCRPAKLEKLVASMPPAMKPQPGN